VDPFSVVTSKVSFVPSHQDVAFRIDRTRNDVRIALWKGKVSDLLCVPCITVHHDQLLAKSLKNVDRSWTVHFEISSCFLDHDTVNDQRMPVS
jgi:hypothetical protein